MEIMPRNTTPDDAGGTDRQRFCGWLGCTDDAEHVIDHPERGEIVVCSDHANQHEVVRDV